MKKLGAKGQRNLKVFHLVTACMWLGGSLGLNLMAILLGPADDGKVQLGYDLARIFVDDFLIVPGAIGCLLTGLFICWLTPWGFFKHRWVTVKWILTLACILFGTFVQGPMVHMQADISANLGLAALSDPTYASNHEKNIIFGLIMFASIAFMLAISTLKPWKKK